MSEQGYNGWTNYETWCVHRWLSIDQGSRRFWHDAAAEVYDICFGKDNPWSNAIAKLAGRLEYEIEAHHPYRGEFLAKPLETDLYCNLLDSVLSKVNFEEIAESFLDDLDEAGYFQDRYEDESEA